MQEVMTKYIILKNTWTVFNFRVHTIARVSKQLDFANNLPSEFGVYFFQAAVSNQK